MPKSHYLKRNKLTKTYIFLKNFENSTLELWGVSIKTLSDKYTEVEKRTDIDKKVRCQVLAELELQILAKTMELIENLLSFSHAFAGDESKIESSLINYHVKRRFYKDLKNKGITYYSKVFTYPKLSRLNLSKEKKVILKLVYLANIKFFKQFLKICYEFRELNLLAYNKLRHSRTMLIGMPVPDNGDGLYGESIIFDENKNKKVVSKKAVLHSKLICDSYLNLAIMLISIQKDLISNRIHCMECNGGRIPLLNLYFESSTHLNKVIEEINKEIVKDIVRDNIEGSLKILVSFKRINKILDFYKNKIFSAKLGIQNEIEALANNLK